MNLSLLSYLLDNTERGLGSSEQDYILMYAIARAFQVKRVLEIGTNKGLSAYTFCQAVLDNGGTPEIVTVDNWAQGDRREHAEHLFRAAEVNRYIRMVSGESTTVVPTLGADLGGFDLCLIDGGHGTEQCLADFHACKLLAPLLLFHDSLTAGVKAALQTVTREGWRVQGFPTRYVEGDGHGVGIALATRPTE